MAGVAGRGTGRIENTRGTREPCAGVAMVALANRVATRAAGAFWDIDEGTPDVGDMGIAGFEGGTSRGPAWCRRWGTRRGCRIHEGSWSAQL